MKPELEERLAKLHSDPRCCAEDFRHTLEGLQRQEGFAEALRIFTALADPHRLAVVRLLQRYGEMCACDIEAAFDLAHSTVIYHLSLLAEAGIVEVSKDGKWSYYRLSKNFSPKLQSVIKFVGPSQAKPMRCCCCQPHTKGGD